jgi:nucleotide-binding universal stress UspA family protein
MVQFKRIIAALNLTQLDKNVIAYARLIAQQVGAEEVKFFFANRVVDYPFVDEMSGLDISKEVDQFAIRVMQDEVETEFMGMPKDVVFQTLEGDPLHSILQVAIEDETDLIIVGRKRDASDTRRLPIKIARKAPCPVIVVPENASVSLSRIMVPIDFSNCSIRAFEMGVNMAKKFRLKRIYGVNVYYLPLGYSRSGMTGLEYNKVLKSEAQKKFKDLSRHLNIKDVEVKMEYMVSRRPAKIIRKLTRKKGCDLVIMGARGLGSLGLLGSTAENLIYDLKCPVIVVKKKGSGVKLLKEMLERAPRAVEPNLLEEGI